MCVQLTTGVLEVSDNDVMFILSHTCLYLEPVYLCVLPDAHHNSCPNVLELSSQSVDSFNVDVGCTTAANFNRRRSKRLLCKEDSGIIYVRHYTSHLLGLECQS